MPVYKWTLLVNMKLEMYTFTRLMFSINGFFSIDEVKSNKRAWGSPLLEFITVKCLVISSLRQLFYFVNVLLVFSVMPFKIDQNINQNSSIDKVQNLGNETRYIYKDPREDSGQGNISYTRYPKNCFTQTYRDLYGDAMLVHTWMSSNTAEGNQQKHPLPSFATKAWVSSSRNS